MGNKGFTKEVFPGSNTGIGFYSFYDYIIPQDANRIFIIKGGPGVGKSSFMKRVAKEFIELGYDIEVHHCSSDNNSLDGVVIPAKKVALIDGTAPHIVDPKNPGAVDEILNLGEYWDEKEMLKNKDAIIKFNKQISYNFQSAYKYLSAAKSIQDDIENTVEESIDRAKFNNFILQLKSKYLSIEIKDSVGYERHLFDTAITPDGYWDYIETIIPKKYTCHYLKGEYDVIKSTVLYELSKGYQLFGYSVELYHQPLNPNRLQTLIVPDLNIAFTLNQRMERKALDTINFDELIVPAKLYDKLEAIEKDKEVISILFDEAVSRIREAKRLHDDMEKCYIPNMSFEDISKLRDKTIERIKMI